MLLDAEDDSSSVVDQMLGLDAELPEVDCGPGVDDGDPAPCDWPEDCEVLDCDGDWLGDGLDCPPCDCGDPGCGRPGMPLDDLLDCDMHDASNMAPITAAPDMINLRALSTSA